MWPWLVGAVALLLVPEIALRRVGPGALRRISAVVPWRKGPRDNAGQTAERT
jgi:hypothetical protein